ncbi:Nicotinate phosphoribosyltransferase [Lentibacillus sp. JNUCC-1]|uniref:nicotinate phosphoribosyltransferase n=1 Tax=Lentibacillus sp. JNUCC-1 TaxID=2654513 RepID=UPI0012E7EF52|nr:nicotinate phosphoribosyltransferase [Lentibacillus sp. JNUCC-1]MUV36947.1 Nicotinate phosphoribosyltransferase [Lentibacillus sp. JNUCC-1]
MDYDNLTLHTDKYQINMMYAHWKNNTHNRRAVFDAYIRKNPFHNGYSVFAGLEKIVHYVNNLHFTDKDIAYLKEQEENYEEAFLDVLRAFKFTGNIHAMREGEIVFPNEPLLRIEASIFEAQLLETTILNIMNYQSLIATKASRIKQVAGNDTLVEFGTRRAQEADAAIWGARAAYIAGFHGTSNMRAGKLFGIPTKGTHAHSWIQDHDSEEQAFMHFAKALPDQAILLVDTYDTLRSGIPNAIKVGKWLESQGKRLKGIRLDSGDLARLSIEGRKMLDEAGMEHVQIMASSSLDEEVIMHLKLQGAKITSWGIGTKLITGGDNHSLGGVYKLVAKESKTGDGDNAYDPVIKLSEDQEKVVTPGLKKVYRIINRKTNKTEGDYVALEHETVDDEPLLMFDPLFPHKSKRVENYEAVELLQPIFENGEQVYQLPTLDEIHSFHESRFSFMWQETLRMLNPQKYYVDLSYDLWQMKQQMIEKHSMK